MPFGAATINKNRGEVQVRVNYLVVLSIVALTTKGPAADETLPQTVAESSEFQSTSSSAEVSRFIKICAEKGPHVNRFAFGKTVDGKDLIGATVSRKSYSPGNTDDRIVVLVIGNIHSGECAGKEALLMMLRELAHNPQHEWLDHLVLIIVPNYNADANDQMARNNRPGQIGPANGMGKRANSQGFDLNRDFVKTESPEARALVKLIDKTNPHLFIDCHTTNGSRHRYSLTYDIPHNPATALPIRSFLRDRMMPAVTDELERHRLSTFYYGNFDAQHTTWTTYGHEPRYSTEYVGLRGRLSILSEAYSYITYKDRILATKQFVSECLNFVNDHHDDVANLLSSVDKELIEVASAKPETMQLALDAKVSAFDENFVIKGFKDDKPFDYTCRFVGRYDAVDSTALPYAYLIPAKMTNVVDQLKRHGIGVARISKELYLDIEVDTITQVNRAERAFQQHHMLRAKSSRRIEGRVIPTGTWVVRTAQPLGRLAAYMLEARSNDGLVVWNFLDSVVEKDRDYPILRVPRARALPTE